jgi:hypothetical protein
MAHGEIKNRINSADVQFIIFYSYEMYHRFFKRQGTS